MADDDYSAFEPVQSSVQDPAFTVGQTEAESAPLEQQQYDYSAFEPVSQPAQDYSADRAASDRLNARYNNPGALGPTRSALKYGGTPSGHYDTGHPFMQFPTPEAGAAAQFSMWQNRELYRDHTLRDAITNWIGKGEHGEAEYMASKIGLPLNTVITDEMLRGPMGIELMKAQAHYEGANVLTDDQWQRAQDWAYKGAQPGGKSYDYSAFEPVGDQTQTHDYSAFQSATNQPEYAGTDKPEPAKPQEQNPWDVGKFLQTFVGSGVQQLLRSEKGQAEAQLHPETRQVLPYEEQTQQAKEDAILKDPNTSREEADDIIHQRNQRLAYVKANARTNVEEASGGLQAAQARVDQGYEATPAGQVAKTLGTGAASLTPALTGSAFAPLALATQMGGQTFDEEFQRGAEAARKAHPEYTPDQINAAATQAAENASRTSAETGVILALLPVPKIGPLLARVVERVGMRGAYMTVAGAVQDISANKELQNIDPHQALYDGVLARMPANFVAGAAFEAPGAVGEAFNRPSAAPETPQEAPEAKTAPETPTQPEKIVAAANRYSNGTVFTGTDHGEVASKAYKSGEPLAQIDQETGAPGEYPEEGFVTNTGRFVDRNEAHTIATAGKSQGSLTAEQLQTGKAAPDVWQHQYQGGSPPKPEDRPMYFTEDGKDWYPADTQYKNIGGKIRANLDFKNPAMESTMSQSDYQKVADIWRKNGGDPEDVNAWLQAAKLKSGEQWWAMELPGLKEAFQQAGYDGIIVDESHKMKMAISLEPKNQVKPIQETEQWVSAIANRYLQERSEAGEIGEITPGKGTTPEAMLAKGTQMGPEEIAQHVSDLMHDKGDPKLQAAAVRAREAQLSQDSQRMSRIADANPNDAQARANADEAFEHLNTFLNGPVAKIKQNFHYTGEALQRRIPVDVSTINGLREAWLRDVGTRINPSLEMTMKNTAARVRKAVAAEDAAMQRMGREIEKPPTRLSDEDVRNNIIARMKNEPCVT